MRKRLAARIVLASGAAMALAAIVVPVQTQSGHKDLSGVWDYAMLTPLERPARFANKEFLTPAEAAELRAQVAARAENDDRPLPTGQVGGYNQFWYEPGTSVVSTMRSSLITDPPDGRLPPLTPEAQTRADAHRQQLRDPAAGPEQRDASERCILGYNAGPPMIGVGYNQHVQIVQTDDYILLANEMVHNARVVRIGGTHLPAQIHPWSGDSVGHWEGDTLVVDTTNFTDQVWNQFSQWNWASDQNLHVVERFTRVDEKTLRYEFTVEDPTVWTKPWTAVEEMTLTTEQMFEYACHEANYGMLGILRGARLQERESGKR